MYPCLSFYCLLLSVCCYLLIFLSLSSFVDHFCVYFFLLFCFSSFHIHVFAMCLWIRLDCSIFSRTYFNFTHSVCFFPSVIYSHFYCVNNTNTLPYHSLSLSVCLYHFCSQFSKML